MTRMGLYVRLEAKPGKEDEVAGFLEQGLTMANKEATTPVWLAVRFGPRTFAIFDAFSREEDRKAHLEGPIAAALMAKAGELLASPLQIEPYDILGAKLPG